MRYDVIIIGAGLGGLECAALLAGAGRSVLLLERGARIGGCLQSYRREGFSFDTGFHYVGGLGAGESLRAAFGCLGLLDLPWHRLDTAFDRVLIGDRSFAFNQGFDAFADGFEREFPAEREAIRRYAALLRQVGQRQWGGLDPSAAEESFSADLLATGAWDYLTRNFRDPLLINALSATSLKMELRKESLPLFTLAHGNSGFIESAWRLAGDGSLIAQRLAERIRERGGTIRCRSAVTELVERGGRLVAARCADGEEYEGDLFVSDVHPALTCGWVRRSERMRPVYRHRLQRMANTFGMFTVSLLLKPGATRYFNWNQYVYRRADVWDFYQKDAPVGGVLVSCRVPTDGSGYARQIDLLTPMPWTRCADWGDTSVGRRGEAYEAMKRRMADECVALAERFLPGLSGMVERRYTSTPLTYRDYTATPEGSAYGARKDYREPLTTVLSPRTPIPNLLLTGQNLMLHGVHGVTMTALLTCAEALGRAYIWNLLKGGNE